MPQRELGAGRGLGESEGALGAWRPGERTVRSGGGHPGQQEVKAGAEAGSGGVGAGRRGEGLPFNKEQGLVVASFAPGVGASCWPARGAGPPCAEGPRPGGREGLPVGGEPTVGGRQWQEGISRSHTVL